MNISLQVTDPTPSSPEGKKKLEREFRIVHTENHRTEKAVGK